MYKYKLNISEKHVWEKFVGHFGEILMWRDVRNRLDVEFGSVHTTSIVGTRSWNYSLEPFWEL